jgi:hypothetical protein
MLRSVGRARFMLGVVVWPVDDTGVWKLSVNGGPVLCLFGRGGQTDCAECGSFGRKVGVDRSNVTEISRNEERYR